MSEDFQDELKELMKLYQGNMKAHKNSMKDIIPVMVHYMENFCKKFNEYSIAENNLLCLKTKLGCKDQDGEDE